MIKNIDKDLIKDELSEEFDMKYSKKEFDKLFDIFTSVLKKNKIESVIELSEPGDSEFPEDDEIRSKYLNDKDDENIVLYAQGNNKPIGTYKVEQEMINLANSSSLNWNKFFDNNGDLHYWFSAFSSIE